MNETLFFTKVAENPETGCWVWMAGCSSSGYGTFAVNRKNRLAHRVAYELMVGDIPDGLQLDHLCRNRRCVRPDHLDPVPARVNTMRGNTAARENSEKKSCVNGHPFDDANTYLRPDGSRSCRACVRARQRDRYESNKEAERERARVRMRKLRMPEEVK